MSKSSVSYSGKIVYVGIDVHKATYAVCCMCENEFVKTFTCKANPVLLPKNLKQWFPGGTIRSAYEAGYFGYALHRQLIKEGIENIVVNAASIEVAANNRVKTDRRDARKLAKKLSEGDLKGIFIPSEIEELARLLPRTRAQIVEHRADVARQIKAKLNQFNFLPADCRRQISSRFLRQLENENFPAELRVALKYLFDQWRFLTRQLVDIRRRLREVAKTRTEIDVYRSVPGIGLINASVLASELGDLSRFLNERCLFSYTGLTPSEHTSGDHVHRGHISRQGPGRLRRLLVEASWLAIRKDPTLRKLYDRLACTRGGKRAIVAVARHLIGRIRACFRTKTLYQVGSAA
jgi:transposase